MGIEPRYLGQYQMLECIAHGGMGEVWKAVDTHLQRTVAIKLLLSNWRNSAGFVARFQGEARLIASLRHPNIINIHNFAIEERPGEPPLLYMVMDYVEGQTLAQYLVATSKLGLFPPAEDIIYLFSALAQAIDYAHGRGMIHRDIKPANILLDQRDTKQRSMGVPVITDFGIARRQGVSGGTVIGSVVGTPLYVAPEQALGMYEEKRSDLYSLGIILYETLTGIPPFRGDSMLNVIMQHVNQAPTPPERLNKAVSAETSAVILKSIAKKPEDRFCSASEMVIALAEAFKLPAPEPLIQNLRSMPPHAAISLSYVPPLMMANEQAAQPRTAETPPSTQAAHPIDRQEAGTRSMVQTDAIRSLTDMASVSAAPTQISGPQQAAGPPSSAQPSRLRLKHPGWLAGMLGLAVLLLVLGIAGRLWLFAPPASPIIPHGKVQFSHGLGAKHYNQLQITMQNVPNPPGGKVYYAWIDAATSESYIPHWQLKAQQKQIHTGLLSDDKVTNLLTPDALFLITLEDASNPHILVPAIDIHARLYYAELSPQKEATFDIKVCPPSADTSPCI
ncbi:serine/threonine protein kinase [Dictyobacter formicarum]|uniref:non-specific serine/threonine protein kinase n=1 Tax=Dictyobacter formicarum TaxID=2778368 RepID=A0ABQ3VTI8_9CHLR|nr:serine/threonine-protein kinase [Dictyobacter formicarum]GHO88944.1 hypothetical protein KSZ_69500 [Dictyobacter formicarum]